MMSNRDIDTGQPKVGTEYAEQLVRRIVNCFARFLAVFKRDATKIR